MMSREMERILLLAVSFLTLGSVTFVFHCGLLESNTAIEKISYFSPSNIITSLYSWTMVTGDDKSKSLARKYYLELAQLGIGQSDLEGFSEAAFKFDKIDDDLDEVGSIEVHAARGLCIVCETVLGTFLKNVREFSKTLGRPKTENFIAAVIKRGCKKFARLRDELCHELGAVQSPMVFDVVSQLTVSESHACSMLFPNICPEKMPENKANYIDFQRSSSHYHPHHHLMSLTDSKKRSSKNHVYFVHFTDLHLDPGYIVGSEADCPDPLCCRAPFKKAIRQPADSMIGGLKCDSSPGLARNVLETMVNASFLSEALKRFDEKFDGKIEFVAFSGDIVPHDVWAEDKSKVESTLRVAFSLFKDVFDSSLQKIPFYMALGNHEGAPVNAFPPKNINVTSNNSWLYELMENNQRPWLPEKHKTDTMRQSGFYSVKRMKSSLGSGPIGGSKDLRIITINSNFCYRLNWWLYVHFGDEHDPDRMLEWLALELEDAQARHEAVYILGHVPPGISDCLGAWSKSFVKIVNKYAKDTVMGVFFGHTHSDQIQIFHDENEIPSLISWISPSVTPFESGVPAFRVFQADATTWQITNAFTFYGSRNDESGKSIIESSNDRRISWNLAYDFKSAFGIATEEINAVRLKVLLDQILASDAKFQKYFIETVMRGQGLAQEQAKKAINRCAKSSHHRKTGNPITDCRTHFISQTFIFETIN